MPVFETGVKAIEPDFTNGFNMAFKIGQVENDRFIQLSLLSFIGIVFFLNR